MTNNSASGTVVGSIATSVITGFVAVLPSEVAGYAVKLFSVFVLAMVAEAGRRLVKSLWERKR
jgi:hypothetical protein